MRSLPANHWTYPLIAGVAGVVMMLRIFSTTLVFSHTVDEPYHIGGAIVLWESKDATVSAQHPPLARWVIGLPLMARGIRYPAAEGNYVVSDFAGFGVGFDILFDSELPYRTILLMARHALLIFSVLALVYLYRLGRYLANGLVAMLATLFFSTDPTLLAHGALVGTDAAACAGFLFGLYYGVRFIARPNRRRAIVAAVGLGLAVTCKFSVLLLIPILLLIALVRALLATTKWPMFRRVFQPRRIALMAAIGFVVIWACYGFAVNPMRHQAMLTNEPLWQAVPQVLREQPIPMPSFWLGQIFLFSRAGAIGQATYLNGEVSFTGWPLYFPEALAVKEPVGFLVALLAGIVLMFMQRAGQSRRWMRWSVLLLPILFYFGLTLRSRYQLGIRHLLPVLPLMYLFAVIQLSRFRQHGLVILLIAAGFIETAARHPDYLAFFNIAAGGPAKGDRYLIDSNLDWGQDLFRLAEYLKSDDIRGRPYTIRVSYAHPRLIEHLGLQPESLTDPPRGGLLAISKNVLHRFEKAEQLPDGSFVLGEDYSWVSRYPVVKRIGWSIDVYDLDAKDFPPRTN